MRAVELDDVIDQVIAERVINRHRGKWIALFALLVVLALVILVLGGWKAPTGRQVPTYKAPYTVAAGRFEFSFESAELKITPATKYDEAKTTVSVTVFIKNIDGETRTTYSMSGNLLRLVPTKGKLVESNGATCDADLNYKIVYGLPAKKCTASFDVPASYRDTAVEIGVFAESYESDDDPMATDQPYWHNEKAVAVVQLEAKIVTEKES
jgi:hypothetical protein